MKKFHELLEQRWFSNLFVVCAGILFYLLMTHLYMFAGAFGAVRRVVAPIIIGIIIAYLLDPLAKFFELKVLHRMKNEKVRRYIGVVLAILVVLLLVGLFFAMLVPSLISSVVGIASNAETYGKNIQKMMSDINRVMPNLKLEPEKFVSFAEGILNQVMTYATKNSGDILSASTNIGKSVFNGLIGFIIGIYILLSKRYLLDGIYEIRKGFIPAEQLKKNNAFWARVHEIFIQFIGYDLLEGLIVGAINAIVMAILGMPFIPLISVVVGVTNLLPTFGPMVGGVVGTIILLLNNPIHALWFIIMVIVIQTIDGYIIKPRLFGGSFGIPAVWTLIAIILGGQMFQVVGILLAIPFAAIINILYKEQFVPWLAKRKVKINKAN
ncbi:MAG: AI-2E family transporter [Lachnospiraceae bacterium]|nr:AI-2E family transporter [Lachnospiraceae bacterium]